MRRLALVALAAPLLVACGSKEAQAPSAPARTNGQIIYSVSQGGGDQPVFENCPGLWTVNPDGTDPQAIGPDDSGSPALSPDGKRLAIFLEGAGEGPDVWTMDLTSGKVRRLAQSIESSPYVTPWFTWSPGNDALLLVHTVAGRDRIDRIEVASGKTKSLVEGGKDELAFPSWSPDGSRIVYSVLSEKRVEVWLMAPDGSKRRKLVEHGTSPVWFPDGERVAYFDSDGLYRAAALRSVSVSGGDENTLTDAFNAGPSSVQWSPDGKSFLFVREAKKPTESIESDIFRFDLDGKREKLVASTADPAGWSPEGDRVLFSREFPSGVSTIVGVYTSTPDGDDVQLVAVNNEGDLVGPPVWRPADGELVGPKGFAKFNAESPCPARLLRLKERMERRAKG